jgi:hypothetical protein
MIAAYVANFLLNFLPIYLSTMFLLYLPLVGLSILRNMSDTVAYCVLLATGTFLVLSTIYNLWIREHNRLEWADQWETLAHPCMLLSNYVLALIGSYECLKYSAKIPLERFSRTALWELACREERFAEPTAIGFLLLLVLWLALRRPFRETFIYLRGKKHLRRAMRILASVSCLVGIGLVVVPSGVRFLLKTILLGAPRDVSAFVLGPIIGTLIVSFLLITALGVLSANLTEVSREWVWWFGGRLILSLTVGTVLSVTAFYSPNLIESGLATQLGLGIAVVVAVLLLIAPYVEVTKMRSWLRRTIGATQRGIVFVAATAFLVFVADWNYHLVADAITRGKSIEYWQVVESMATRPILFYCLAAGALPILITSRTGNNRFSMHSFYRSRLVRCYLRPSSPEEGGIDPFTDFSAKDDLPLGDFVTSRDYCGPIPIFNAALSVLAGEDLAWQDRKAAAFSITPFFCGFETREYVKPVSSPRVIWPLNSPSTASRFDDGGFSLTKDYGSSLGVSVGHAMAISGAALSPSMGERTSRPLGFLLSVFNVRLGWWAPNSWLRRKYQVEPRNRLLTLARELFAVTNETADSIYLTDGGHFENLGIYELVKRRCQVIIAIDGSEDGGLNYRGLATAIERCRVDFGVEISFDFQEGMTCSIGQICYSKDRPESNGRILYVKADVRAGVPVDVWAYHRRHPSFPHETTNNQWFGENQFESYRMLGEFCTRKALEEKGPELLEVGFG